MPNGTKCLMEQNAQSGQNVQAKLTSLLTSFMTLNFFLFSSTSFLGTSRSYFFPPTILLTLHEISLYFAITTQNTLK